MGLGYSFGKDSMMRVGIGRGVFEAEEDMLYHDLIKDGQIVRQRISPYRVAPVGPRMWLREEARVICFR